MLQRAAQTNTSGSLTLLALVEHAEAMAEADADAAAAVAGGVYALDDFAAFPPKTQARVAALAADRVAAELRAYRIQSLGPEGPADRGPGRIFLNFRSSIQRIVVMTSAPLKDQARNSTTVWRAADTAHHLHPFTDFRGLAEEGGSRIIVKDRNDFLQNLQECDL